MEVVDVRVRIVWSVVDVRVRVVIVWRWLM